MLDDSIKELGARILGGMLVDHGLAVRYLDDLDDDMFREPMSRHLFRFMRHAVSDGVTGRGRSLWGERGIDATLVPVPDEVTVGAFRNYIADLILQAPSLDEDLDQVVENLKRACSRRRLRELLPKIDQALTSTPLSSDLREVWAPVEQELVMSAGRSAVEAMESHVTSTLEVVDQAMRRREAGELPGLSTGLPDLDEMTLGFHPGDEIVIAARPSMGKTALSLDIGMNVARHGRKVLFFSMEMPPEQVLMRCGAKMTGLSLHRIRSGDLDDDEYSRFTEAMLELSSNRNLVVCDAAGMSYGRIASRCRAEPDLAGSGMVVIDYLQLIPTSSPGRGDVTRAEQIGRLSRGLKLLARDLRVPVVVLSQLNRNLEHRADRRPVLSDLRESGSIEQDADLILFIYREHVYDPSADERRVEIIVGKQRNGPVGIVPAGFDPGTASFLGAEDAGFRLSAENEDGLRSEVEEIRNLAREGMWDPGF